MALQRRLQRLCFGAREQAQVVHTIGGSALLDGAQFIHLIGTGRHDELAAALVGDAAHGIHPIAGQGVNLGYRDVAALVEVLVEGRRLGLEAGDAQLLARYARWRGFDTFSVAAATDVLTRLFGVPGRAAGLVRRIGISAVDRLPPLKERFMAEARGESGHLPKLLTGLTV